MTKPNPSRPYTQFPFGCPVLVHGTMGRAYGVSSAGSYPVYWKPYSFTPSRTGFYIGYRYLKNGIIRHITQSWNKTTSEFTQTDSILVALVATSPRTNPIYVPFTHMEITV